MHRRLIYEAHTHAIPETRERVTHEVKAHRDVPDAGGREGLSPPLLERLAQPNLMP